MMQLKTTDESTGIITINANLDYENKKPIDEREIRKDLF